MNIKNLFTKPLDRSINGVVKADQDDDKTVYQELDEYVVTKELEKHIRDFFKSYGTDLSDASISGRVGVWISGFFGSGKSHFLKVLSYILENKSVCKGTDHQRHAIDFFDEQKIKDPDIRSSVIHAVNHPADVILFNIDSKASSNDEGNPILNVFLRVFNEYQGFSGDHPHIAHMERHLTQKGVYNAFKEAFHSSSGSNWEEERDGYHFLQDDVEQAIAKALHMSAEAAHKWFEESEDTFSVSVENFCYWVKTYLETKESNQRILFMVDEVGQFIGSDTRLMLTLQTITENLGTICNGRAWIVVTSQSDMDAVLGELSSSKANDFSKIAGRFKTRLSLSSSNTDEVIQKRLLNKTDEAITELTKLFEMKGDVLKNQISFDRSGPSLKNYEGTESFVNNYPFAPYHFQLVQKVFEEIRKVGATGAHLAYGERSMLDAFQMSANAIADKEVGALVPMYNFYSSVEGFLDTAVKRTIDQAEENSILDEFDVQVLRTLFMIRYVDLIKGSLDNLVTLSIEKVDEDKLALRKQLETSLHRLEKENLITRNGDEFIFLTNEERDISKKIKATDLSGSEENKELSNLIYKDLLKDINKYRHQPNKKDYGLSRYLDGHTIDNKFDNELKIEIISPLDPDYSTYSDAECFTKSSEGSGQIIIKLNDDQSFFTELRTWLKTNKFIRLNSDGSQSDITRILADRGRENQERKKRLRTKTEEMWLNAKVFTLGQHLDLSTSGVQARLDEMCQYLLENTFNKLSYLDKYHDDPWQELERLLNHYDAGQVESDLPGQQKNASALQELEQFITLKSSGNHRVLISDVVDRFSTRPYGWPDAEILLMIGRLAVTDHVSLQRSGGTLAASDAYDILKNSRLRREISIIKKRRTGEGVLKKARQLTQTLFSSMGPEAEKDLFEFYQRRFNDWRENLRGYKIQAEAGDFPGLEAISNCQLLLDRTLRISDSFDFFKQIIEQQDDYLDLEKDYSEVDEFFNKQVTIWAQLKHALIKFDRNSQYLEQSIAAETALSQLRDIKEASKPYEQLHLVTGLINQVDAVNQHHLSDKRSQAIKSIDQQVLRLKAEIEKSICASADLSNQLLRPLQELKDKLSKMDSIADIHFLQSETLGNKFNDGLNFLQEAEQRAFERKNKEKQPTDRVGSKEGLSESSGGEQAKASTAKSIEPKIVTEVDVSAIYRKHVDGVYLDSQEAVDQFVNALRTELKQVIENNHRALIK